MGSVSSIPEKLSEDDISRICGSQFDMDDFYSMQDEDGYINRQQFLQSLNRKCEKDTKLKFTDLCPLSTMSLEDFLQLCKDTLLYDTVNFTSSVATRLYNETIKESGDFDGLKYEGFRNILILKIAHTKGVHELHILLQITRTDSVPVHDDGYSYNGEETVDESTEEVAEHEDEIIEDEDVDITYTYTPQKYNKSTSLDPDASSTSDVRPPESSRPSRSYNRQGVSYKGSPTKTKEQLKLDQEYLFYRLSDFKDLEYHYRIQQETEEEYQRMIQRRTKLVYEFPELRPIFEKYTRNNEMTSLQFMKFVVESNLITNTFTKEDADLLFAKAKLRACGYEYFAQGKKVNFEIFCSECIPAIAERRKNWHGEGIDSAMNRLRAYLARIDLSALQVVTPAVRLHDDKSTYTGTQATKNNPEPDQLAQIRAKKKLKPVTKKELWGKFMEYCPTGELTSSDFTKMMREREMFNKTFTQKDAEVLYTKVVSAGKVPGQKISFETFRTKLLPGVAEKRAEKIEETTSLLYHGKQDTSNRASRRKLSSAFSGGGGPSIDIRVGGRQRRGSASSIGSDGASDSGSVQSGFGGRMNEAWKPSLKPVVAFEEQAILSTKHVPKYQSEGPEKNVMFDRGATSGSDGASSRAFSTGGAMRSEEPSSRGERGFAYHDEPPVDRGNFEGYPSLKPIFRKYCPSGEILLYQFQKLLKDVRLLDRKLSVGEAELIFNRISSAGTHPGLSEKIDFQIFCSELLPAIARKRSESIDEVISYLALDDSLNMHREEPVAAPPRQSRAPAPELPVAVAYPELKPVFRKYCPSGEMLLFQFQKMVRDTKLLDEYFSSGDAEAIYTNAKNRSTGGGQAALGHAVTFEVFCSYVIPAVAKKKGDPLESVMTLLLASEDSRSPSQASNRASEPTSYRNNSRNGTSHDRDYGDNSVSSRRGSRDATPVQDRQSPRLDANDYPAFKSVFRKFVHSYAPEKEMTLVQFQQLARDTRLIGSSLTSADVESIYNKATARTGGSMMIGQLLTFEKFFNIVVPAIAAKRRQTVEDLHAFLDSGDTSMSTGPRVGDRGGRSSRTGEQSSLAGNDGLSVLTTFGTNLEAKRGGSKNQSSPGNDAPNPADTTAKAHRPAKRMAASAASNTSSLKLY